jgi:hypothetical protein
MITLFTQVAFKGSARQRIGALIATLLIDVGVILCA